LEDNGKGNSRFPSGMTKNLGMTNKKQAKANAGILRYAQNDNTFWHTAIGGML
jgi:hypothetical protein